MITRRTFIASAAAPAALPFYHPASPIESLYREVRRRHGVFNDQDPVYLSDDDFFALSDWTIEAEKALFAESPRTVRDFSLQFLAIDLDLDSAPHLKTFAASARRISGEVE